MKINTFGSGNFSTGSMCISFFNSQRGGIFVGDKLKGVLHWDKYNRGQSGIRLAGDIQYLGKQRREFIVHKGPSGNKNPWIRDYGHRSKWSRPRPSSRSRSRFCNSNLRRSHNRNRSRSREYHSKKCDQSLSVWSRKCLNNMRSLQRDHMNITRNSGKQQNY